MGPHRLLAAEVSLLRKGSLSQRYPSSNRLWGQHGIIGLPRAPVLCPTKFLTPGSLQAPSTILDSEREQTSHSALIPEDFSLHSYILNDWVIMLVRTPQAIIIKSPFGLSLFQ